MPIYRRTGESIIITPQVSGEQRSVTVLNIDLETRTATFGFSQGGSFVSSDPIKQGEAYQPQTDLHFRLEAVQRDPRYREHIEVVLRYDARAPYRFESERRHAARTAQKPPKSYKRKRPIFSED